MPSACNVGEGELMMFGGLMPDRRGSEQCQVSDDVLNNVVYIISAK